MKPLDKFGDNKIPLPNLSTLTVEDRLMTARDRLTNLIVRDRLTTLTGLLITLSLSWIVLSYMLIIISDSLTMLTFRYKVQYDYS